MRKGAAKRRAKRRKEPAHIQWRRALLARRHHGAAPKRKFLDKYRLAMAKDITKCKRTFFPDPQEWSAARRRRAPREDLAEIKGSCTAAKATGEIRFEHMSTNMQGF